MSLFPSNKLTCSAIASPPRLIFGGKVDIYRLKWKTVLLEKAISENDVKAVKALLDGGVTLKNNHYKNHRGPLHLAAEKKHYNIINMLIDAGADVNAMDDHCMRPLHCIAIHLKYTVKKGRSLIENLEDPQLYDLDVHGERLFRHSIFCGRYNVAVLNLSRNTFYRQVPVSSLNPEEQSYTIKRMIEEGVEIDATNVEGKSSLYFAIEVKNYEVAKILIDAGASTDFTGFENFWPLYQTACVDDWNLFQLLLTLEKGGDVINRMNGPRGLTFLQIAANYGNINTVIGLLEMGADIHIRSNEGFGVLYYAADPDHKREGVDLKNYVDLLKCLILKGAEVRFVEDQQNWRNLRKIKKSNKISPVVPRRNAGITTLDSICAYANGEILGLLVERGLNLAKLAPSESQKLFFQTATNRHDTEILKFIVENVNVNVNAKNAIGRTALHEAVLCRNISSVKYLTMNGANINCLTQKYLYRSIETPLLQAISMFDNRIVRLLLLFHSDINHEILPLSIAVNVLLPCDSLFEIQQKIVRTIIRHIVFLEFRRKPISRENYRIISSKESWQKYYEECKKTLKCTLDFLIDDIISFPSRPTVAQMDFNDKCLRMIRDKNKNPVHFFVKCCDDGVTRLSNLWKKFKVSVRNRAKVSISCSRK